MNTVTRSEVLGRAEYEAVRDGFRKRVLAEKAVRRIHVGPHLTFLFENHATVLYQIQEMLRSENITLEAAIQHEIDTYNELLGSAGELGCTLLIEIDDKERRAELLSRWQDLPGSLYIRTRNGRRVHAEFDRRQVDADRISAVQYLKFRIGDDIPVAVGASHPDIAAETSLTPAESAALAADLL